MRIAIVASSIYMSEKTYPDRIFAPRMITLQLADSLVDKGHNVTLFSAPDITTKAKLIGGPQDLLKGDLIRDKFLNRELLAEYKIESAIESKSLYSLELIGKVFQENKKEKFDIIQTDDPLMHPLVGLSNTSVAFTFHDPLPRMQSLDYWFLNAYKQHNFISISMAQRRGEPALNFVGNVYHGLNKKNYIPSFRKGEYLAYFGRLLVQKGADIAIKVTKESKESLRIASDKTHFNTHFVKDNIIPFIDEQTISHVGLMKTLKEKSAFLSNAKALLLPILWDEPFGLVLIEAMACGTPVIAFNRGSVPEVIKDGITGFIIDQDDQDRPGKGTWTIKTQGIAGLIEAVHRIEEIDRVTCRKNFEENFTNERMATGYENVYKKILNII